MRNADCGLRNTEYGTRIAERGRRKPSNPCSLCAAIVGKSCFFARILVVVLVFEDEPTNEKTEWNFSNEHRSQSRQSTPSRTRTSTTTRTIWLRFAALLTFCSDLRVRAAAVCGVTWTVSPNGLVILTYSGSFVRTRGLPAPCRQRSRSA
jgi:hypothetical protein